jgi:hypothetical protein
MALVLGGCAALRVDVDVYKGPLANHEDVQVRQYAALAVAARPVLASLRNRLEDRERERTGFGPQFFSKRLESYERYGWIRDDNRFSSETARIVNGALSFYEDAGDRVVSLGVNEATSVFERFIIAYRKFDYDDRADAPLADSIEKLHPILQTKPNTNLAIVEHQINRFAREHARFLRAGVREKGAIKRAARDEKGIMNACNDLKRALAKLLPREDVGKLPHRIRELRCADGGSANEIFKFMAHPQVIEVYSHIVFREARREFIDRMTDIAQNFVVSRREMRNLWLVNLALVELLASSGMEPALHNAARALSKVSQPRSLACYFTSDFDSGGEALALGQQGIGPDRLNKLRSLLGSETSTMLFATNIVWNAGGYREAEGVIERAAIRFPREFVALLRYADARFASALDHELGNCRALSPKDLASVKPIAAREFGLARGPTLGEEFRELLGVIKDSLEAVAIGTAAGFERARPADGLETLTQEFLASLASNNHDPRNERVALARKRLEESLILWAERVLVAVNNRALLPPSGPDEGGAKEQAREVAVLQAVGNNILVHADDLRRREDHERRLKERAIPEARAVRQAFDLTAAQTLDNLLRNLRAHIERLGKEAAPSVATPPEGGKPIDAAKSKLEAKSTERQKAEQSADAVFAAAATVAAPLPPSLPKSDPEAAKDSESIASQIKKLGADKNSDNVLTEITRAVEALHNLATTSAAGKESVRAKRLENAKKYLEDKKAVLAHIADAMVNPDPGKILAELQKKLRDDAMQERSHVQRLREEEASLDQQVKKLASQEAAAVSARDYAAVRDIFIEIRGEVLKQADERGADAPQALLNLLADTLRAKSAGITGADSGAQERKKVFGLALKVVQDTTPPRAPALAEAKSGDRRTQRDLADDVLALLRNQRIQALASGEISRAANLDSAIKRLYEGRADLAYLRPTSAYLRSVYAATSLQAEPDVGWVNLLSRNTGRAMGSGQGDAYQKEYLQTLAEIDKQHWQTINTVTLAGGGSTNYVLAKDDIGNWYVKGYEANPEAIIRSAKGLALFGLGAKFDVNLVRRDYLQSKLGDPEASDEQKKAYQDELKQLDQKPGRAGTASLSEVQKQYAKEYADKTAQDASALRGALGRLRDDLVTAWKADIKPDPDDQRVQKLVDDQLGTNPQEIQTATAALDKAEAIAESERTSQRASAIIEGLKAVRRLRARLTLGVERYDDLVKPERESYAKELSSPAESDPEKQKARQSRIEATKAKLEAAEAKRKAAARSTARLLDELAIYFADRRLSTTQQLETAITFIGEAAGSGK